MAELFEDALRKRDIYAAATCLQIMSLTANRAKLEPLANRIFEKCNVNQEQRLKTAPMPEDAEKLKSKAKKRSIGENDDNSSNAEPPRKRSKAIRLPTEDEDAKYVETKRALKKYSAGKTSEMLRVIKFAFKAPPFKLELPVYLRYSSYQLSSYRDRCQLLKDNSELTRINVEPNIITLNAHLNLLKRIRNDPELKTYYEYQETENKDLGRCMRFIAQRIKSKEYFPAYEPPKNRIRIKSNLTFNENDVIPVYSDLEGETLESLEIPVTLTYDYTDVNMVHMASVHRAQFNESDHNAPLKNTSWSKNNEKSGGVQVRSAGRSDSRYPSNPSTSTTGRIITTITPGSRAPSFADAVEKCTNNSMLLPHKKLFPLEIYRNDPVVGFVVRSTVMIPAGTPLMEFTGEIVELENMEPDNRDYVYQITYSDDVKFRRLLQEKEVLHRSENPRNVARTVGHACAPNMEVVRVFQKSLSPAHLHLVLVTLEDVFPVLKDRCRCGTFACRRGEHVKTYKNFETAQLAHCLKKIHDTRYDKWNKDKKKIAIWPRKNEKSAF
eukprot:NP_872261.2 SET (trithorax/polycomb) domain containing [Caenorhabditis elegans]